MVFGCLKSFAYFWLGTGLMVVLSYVMPTLITTLNTFFTNSNITSVTYLILYFCMVLFMIIIPVAMAYSNMDIDATNPIIGVTFLVIFMLLNILVFYKGWFMFQAVASMITESVVLVTFWIGLLISFINMTFIYPIYGITKLLGAR